jgi:DNA mismatch repair protein MutS2
MIFEYHTAIFSTDVLQAGRSGDLPKGSVKVGQSQSGATHYFEPAPAVPLNNAETLLEEAEKKEEDQVMGERAMPQG